VVTFRKNAVDEGIKSLEAKGFSVADASSLRAMTSENMSNIHALTFPAIRSAVVSSPVLEGLGISEAHSRIQAQGKIMGEGPIEVIEPEYFVFADNSEYLRGFCCAANTIAIDLGAQKGAIYEKKVVSTQDSEATWGLVQCKVPSSSFSDLGIKVAVLEILA
jgi:hypothetical protein